MNENTNGAVNGVVGKLSSIAKRILSPELRKMHKAGFVADDLSITKKGMNRMLAILFEGDELRKALAEEAEADIQEQKENCK